MYAKSGNFPLATWALHTAGVADVHSSTTEGTAMQGKDSLAHATTTVTAEHSSDSAGSGTLLAIEDYGERVALMKPIGCLKVDDSSAFRE